MLFPQDFVSSAIWYMSELIFWLVTGATSLVEFGKHRATIIGEGEFIDFWKAAALVIIPILLLVLISDTAVSFIDVILFQYAAYSFGVTVAVVGTWFTWLVLSNEYDLKEDWKWAFPALCYAMTGVNFAIVYFGKVG